MNYVGENVLVRSSIYCKSPNICQICYGDLWKSLDSRFVGVIAAQSCGECNTQLVLRTFHTSGVAVIKGDDDNDSNRNDMCCVHSQDRMAVYRIIGLFHNQEYDNDFIFCKECLNKLQMKTALKLMGLENTGR